VLRATTWRFPDCTRLGCYQRAEQDARAHINITGGLGAVVVDRLHEQADGADRVFDVNVAGKARDEAQNLPVRIESWKRAGLAEKRGAGEAGRKFDL
jgi:hypothetical protein